MASYSMSIFISLQTLLFLSSFQLTHARISQPMVKTEVFLSPKFELEPGLVSNKYYTDIDFPRGHLALKMFTAELVDESGSPVPLHETYLHHWVLSRYYLSKNATGNYQNDHGFRYPDAILVKNDGPCDNGLTQYYGVGAETRKTPTYVPDPYGIEIGNPADIPEGYKEGWLLNVHAIDTRGATDRWGCAECRCDLYNVTEDENGEPLPKSYKGGLRCCRDDLRCKVEEGGFHGTRRSLYLRCTVKYADWDASSIVPVKIYIIDVTDILTRGDQSRGIKDRHTCLVEYDVDSCSEAAENGSCIDTRTATVSLPGGGDLIYGVGHQHVAATGITLYGEGGRVICSSKPIYGQGHEPGNEAGYVVGISTCYPSPGSVKIRKGEKLTVVSNYTNDVSHTGVMGFFYILVADSSNEQKITLQALKTMMMSKFVWPIVLCGIVVVVFALKGKKGKGDGYEAMI